MSYRRFNIGVGHLICPSDVNRENFIAESFTKQKFVILTNNSEMIVDVPCTIQILNDLRYGEVGKLGTCVVYVVLPYQDTPIIIGTLPEMNTSSFRGESDYILSKSYGDCEVNFSGSLFFNRLILSIKSISKKICRFLIDISGSEDSKLTLNSSGYVIVKGDKEIQIKGGNKEIFINNDEILITNTNKQYIKITDKEGLDYKDGLSNRFRINKEGYILGNINFEQYITEILNFLGNDFVLNTTMGPSAPGCMATSAGAKWQMLLQKIKNINKDK